MNIVFVFESSFLKIENGKEKITNEIRIHFFEEKPGIFREYDAICTTHPTLFPSRDLEKTRYVGQPIIFYSPAKPDFLMVKEQVFFDAWLLDRSLEFERDADRLFEAEINKFREELAEYEKVKAQNDQANCQYWFDHDMLLSTQEIWEILQEGLSVLDSFLKKTFKKEQTHEFGMFRLSPNKNGSTAKFTLKVRA